MANNVLAGACYAQGLCDVRWYGLGGPLRGSKTAHATGVAGKLFPGVIRDSLAPETAGIAPSSKGSLSAVVYEKKLLLGAACGTSSWGSGGQTGAMMSLVSASTWGEVKGLLGKLIAGWSSLESDGLVHMDECSKAGLVTPNGTLTLAPLGDFSEDPKAAFYAVDGNHYDLTGSGGNQGGIIDWIRARVVAK